MVRFSIPRALCVGLWLALCPVYLSVPAAAQSQASTGQIAGTVVDSTGATVAGAKITVTNKDTGLKQEITSNAEGNYRLVLLPPGRYTIEATATNFATSKIENVEVLVGRVADTTILMSATGSSEVVTVSAGAVQVQTTSSAADAVQNEVAIKNLPINGRRFQDFVTLTPTAQVEPQRQQLSLAGQRGINANINIDGLDYSQPFFGGLRGGERSNFSFTVPLESIKEFQVVAAGYSPEFGRSTGGIVTVVTKSGTNEYHGSGFYLLRPKDLARSNEFFDTVGRSLSTRARREIEVTPVPTQQQWGGSFGGPIIKNKAFFFFSYEQQRFRADRQVIFDQLLGQPQNVLDLNAPTVNFFRSQEQQFQTTNDAISLLGRVDYEINTNNRFNVRYNFSDAESLNGVGVGGVVFPTTNNAVSNNGTEKNRTNTVLGQYTSFFTPTTVNELRVQYSRESRPRLANEETPTVASTIGQFGSVIFLPTTQFDWRLQVADNITKTLGNHTFKFGVDYSYVRTGQDFGQSQFGDFRFVGVTDVPNQLDILTPGGPVANRFDSTAVRYRRQLGNLDALLWLHEPAVFAQDAWRIKPNFTLNYGVRWEGQFNSQPEVGNDALINRIKDFNFPVGLKTDPTRIPNSPNQWAPRVGFAWDPEKNGKSVIRAFGGMYYARTPLLVFSGPSNNFRSTPGDLRIELPFAVTAPPGTPAAQIPNTIFRQFQLIGVDLNAAPIGSLPVVTPAQINQIAQRLAQLGFIAGAPDPFFGAQPTSVASGFRNPRSVQFGIGYERQIAQGITVGADFSYVNTTKLQRNHEVNVPIPVPNAEPGRPVFLASGRTRPVPQLGQVTLRDSSARSLYRAATFRINMQRKWGQMNAYYVLSSNYSDSDTERDAGGVEYENGFNLKPEYNYSRLDRRHQFVANPVFFLPFKIDVSAGIRLQSGRPIDALVPGDANSDTFTTDRPYSRAGVPFLRNSFRNRPLYNVDFRVQKRLTFSDRQQLTLSAEFFNLFNIMNIELDGRAVTEYCGQGFASPLNCGFGAPTNPNFLQLRDQRPGSSTLGQLLQNNSVFAPFQFQFGVRYQF